MVRKIGNVLVAILFVAVVTFFATSLSRVNAQTGTQIKAFPGAEGFGANTVGGRGGKV